MGMKTIFLFLSLCVLGNSLCNRNFGPTDALIIIDVQNGFLPLRAQPSGVESTQPVPPENSTEVDSHGNILPGSLAVNFADEIIPIINYWITNFTATESRVMASLDWHPSDSCSFCSTDEICANLGVQECGLDGTEKPSCPESLTRRCMDSVSVSDYMANVYVQWPPHCVQGTWSAQFDSYLQIPDDAIVVKKGFLVQNDSYSAYGGRQSVTPWPFNQDGDTEADLSSQPDLKELIETLGIKRLFVSGIATDYCVKNTILDSLGANVAGIGTRPSTLAEPFSVSLILSASRGVLPETVADAISEVQSKGAVVIPSHITDPQTALHYYCDFVEAQESSSGGDNKAVAIGLGIGLTVLGLAIIAIVCVFCNHRNTVPKSTDYTHTENQDDTYKPLHDL